MVWGRAAYLAELLQVLLRRDPRFPVLRELNRNGLKFLVLSLFRSLTKEVHVLHHAQGVV